MEVQDASVQAIGHPEPQQRPTGVMKKTASTLEFLKCIERAPAVLWSLPSLELDDYSSVYREAARQLLSGATTGALWAFPAIFLYRHAIETSLKAIVKFHTADVTRDHNLKDRLEEVKKIAVETHTSTSPKLIRTVEEFHALDKNATTFRYPSGFKTDDLFDLRSFVDHVEDSLDELADILRDVQTHFIKEEENRSK